MGIRRRDFLQSLGALGALGLVPGGLRAAVGQARAVSVSDLPPLKGALTVYLGRGEGGLYEDIMAAIRERNPELDLRIRRGPTVALANTIVAEAKAGVSRADVFWAVDAGSLGLVGEAGLARPIPADLRGQVRPNFRYDSWVPVSGRIRTLPYNTDRLDRAQVPGDVMALADSDLSIGWAPAYGSFQSFVTAMRLLEGEQATLDWLKAVRGRARAYAGELGVVMGVSRGEVDIGLANHYYTLRLKAGKPDAPLDLGFTKNDAGSLLNASGAMALSDRPVAMDFIRYLLTREVQQYLASEAYEIPLVQGVGTPDGLPELAAVRPPDLALTRLAAVRPTLALMREAGLL